MDVRVTPIGGRKWVWGEAVKFRFPLDHAPTDTSCRYGILTVPQGLYMVVAWGEISWGWVLMQESIDDARILDLGSGNLQWDGVWALASPRVRVWRTLRSTFGDPLSDGHWYARALQPGLTHGAVLERTPGNAVLYLRLT